MILWGFYSCSSFVNQCLLLCSVLLLDCQHFLFLRLGLGSYHSPVQFGVIANLWKLCCLQLVYSVRHFLRTVVSQLCLWCVRCCLFFFPFINPLYLCEDCALVLGFGKTELWLFDGLLIVSYTVKLCSAVVGFTYRVWFQVWVRYSSWTDLILIVLSYHWRSSCRGSYKIWLRNFSNFFCILES